MNANTKIRGFTLMEMAIVLAIISVLIVVLTPIVSSYLERARIDRTQMDLQHLAAAIIQFHTDTQKWPIYASPWDGNPTHAADAMKTNGVEAQIATGVLAGWTLTTTGNIIEVMNSNSLSLDTTGVHAWRGPYATFDMDPWGTAYYLTSKNFAPGSTKAGYLVSAGPNQTIDTQYEQERTDPFVSGGDDLVVQIK